MRCTWLLCFLVGCGFAASVPSGTGAGDPGGQAGVDSGTAGNATCDVAGDPSLQLCLTFDHDPMVQDLSGYAHPITVATGVTRIDRNSLSSAASLTAASRIHVANDLKLNVAPLTIEMWIAPAPGASTPHSWLLDNNAQYFLTYEMDGKIRCGIGSKIVTSTATVPASSWHHVACTYGTDHELHVYVDGDRSGCAIISPTIPVTLTDGIAIGANYSSSGGGSYTENYVGGVDDVHVYGRALSDAQICTVAGRTGCRSLACGQSGPE